MYISPTKYFMFCFCGVQLSQNNVRQNKQNMEHKENMEKDFSYTTSNTEKLTNVIHIALKMM